MFDAKRREMSWVTCRTQFVSWGRSCGKEEPGRSQVIKEQLGLNGNYLETLGQKVGVAKHLGLCERSCYVIFGRI